MMTYNDAQNFAIQGKKIRRRDWNGKGMFIIYIPQRSVPMNEVDPYITNLLNSEKSPEEIDSFVIFRAYFLIKNVDGSLSTWVPSINDVLAIDWEVIEH